MEVTQTVEQTRRAVAEMPRPVGFVATMGALHRGHLALVERARAETRSVVASIFVNPAQFGPSEDLATYPRDLESDLSKLDDMGVDLVFNPTAQEIYPDGFDTHVDVGSVGTVLEGKARPGHFRGVATVVCKLLNIVRPDRAYFGQKDAQQAVVVRRLNADLNLSAEIVVVPTAREADGLALSSRNAFLSPQEREAAVVLHRSLRLARDLWDQGVNDASEIRRRMEELIAAEPLARTDYVSVADPDSLHELDLIDGPALASLAVYVGSTRLIDNDLL